MNLNLAMDAPPTSIEVGGTAYPVNIDFRVWIQITEKLLDIVPEPDSIEEISANLKIIYDIEELAFGGILEDEEISDTMDGIMEFAKGYQDEESDGTGSDGPQLVSLSHDINYLILAIRNQSGIDLSYRRTEPFHWWLFLTEVKSLCGDHYILKLAEIRGYKGKDKEMLRLKSKLALPTRESTHYGQDVIDDINAEFYGA